MTEYTEQDLARDLVRGGIIEYGSGPRADGSDSLRVVLLDGTTHYIDLGTGRALRMKCCDAPYPEGCGVC